MSLKQFEGFLPKNAFVMGKKAVRKAAPAATTTPAAPPAAVPAAEPKVLLAFVGAPSGAGAGAELLEKMIHAMGGSKDQVLLIRESELATANERLEKYRPQAVVVLGPRAEKAVKPGASKLFSTYHPDELIKNPAAKKAAWDQLKPVIALLGWTPKTSK